MSDEPVIYQVFEASRDDPDHSPFETPKAPEGDEWPQAMWVWWRTGPHPQGVWQAMKMDADGSRLCRENNQRHPVFQDQAWGVYNDIGGYSCHSCQYFGDGYPEPGHRTVCDGVCKIEGCSYHSEEETLKRMAARVLYVSQEEYEWLMKELARPPRELPRLRKLFEDYKKESE
jgi:hypothetical protein